MLETCRKIGQLLESVDFGRLWPGFHVFPFALYDDQDVCFSDRPPVPWDSRFLGNTAIDLNGEAVAIWSMKESPISDETVLASKLVHEMFHAFQKKSGETRWADEREGLRYIYDSENMCKKFMENFHLGGFSYSFSRDTWRILMAFRNARAAAFPNAVRYESQIETIEGIAQFVEYSVLRILDIGKYRMAVQRLSEVLNDPKKLFPIRNTCYNSGTMMCIVAEENGISFRHQIGRESRMLSEILGEGIPPHDHKVKIQTVVFEREAFLSERHAKVESFFRNARIVAEGKMELAGFDPMNGFLDGNRLFSPGFLLVKDASGSRFFSGESVALLDSSFNVVQIYQSPS
ncbi:MAG: hypothetical protein FNP40_05745 [Dehalobacter sp. 4CP]|nr:hypothetical protein [Dehalobacter sp. 4CP]